MFNRILVALDGSTLAERAIPHAKQFARIFGSTLVLLQVLDPSPFRENATTVEPLNWQIRKTEVNLYIQGLAVRLRDKGFKVEYALREGRAAENIIDYAQNENIDLLVLTTHGASGMSRWNASSVVEKVISKVYLPVLLVRSWHNTGPDTGQLDQEPATTTTSTHVYGDQAAAAQRSEARQTAPILSGQQHYVPVTAAAGSPADDEAIFYHRILLPIDCSRRAECSLSAGIALAEGQKMGIEPPTGKEPANASESPEIKLILTAVLKPPELPIPAPYPEELQQLSDRFLQLSRETANSYLTELKNRIPVETETRVVENESISGAIHELSEQENADLVVLCAHGRTGRVTWPYGSVARNYIEYGEKPVLVIQDVPRSQMRPTPAEIAAEKYGRR